MTISVGYLADNMVGKYFWTDAHYSTQHDTFLISDGKVFYNHTLDYDITRKVHANTLKSHYKN